MYRMDMTYDHYGRPTKLTPEEREHLEALANECEDAGDAVCELLRRIARFDYPPVSLKVKTETEAHEALANKPLGSRCDYRSGYLEVVEEGGSRFLKGKHDPALERELATADYLLGTGPKPTEQEPFRDFASRYYGQTND